MPVKVEQINEYKLMNTYAQTLYKVQKQKVGVNGVKMNYCENDYEMQ